MKKVLNFCKTYFCLFCLNNLDFSLLCSPELEKGLKKRVKLHTNENGENGQSRENGQNGQNEDVDSDDTYTEVREECWQPS